MPLAPKICVKSTCDKVVIYDQTGVYDPIYNLGGYGSPNPEVGDILTCILTITPPKSDAIEINAFPDLPDINGLGYDVEDSSLNDRTKIESGVWIVSMTLTTADDEFDTTVYHLASCDADCCVAKKELMITDYSNQQARDAYTMRQMLESIKCAFEGSSDKTKAQKVMDYINSQCNCCV